MMVLRLIALFYLFILIGANPIHRNFRQYDPRQRRGLDFMNWRLANSLFERLYNPGNHQIHDERINKRSEIPVELRPVEGPISIEQLPAMLAARYVKRYPYSQIDDPATIGR